MNIFSKSQYAKYLHCPKRLWLYKNKREVMNLPEDGQERRTETGNRVGELARQKFAGGVLRSDRSTAILMLRNLIIARL